ncbi:hypothetical protein AcW1_007900 [Taiwanofungus camphoratus]|nr:hypothetical protein AcW2_007043 [Antrodia cinnamomea]KAI0953759.1 hypothetical protein AcW1_007900 [Antrodia cinnamomea]
MTLCARGPQKSKWNVENIPDLLGKVIIVIGGNNGIGKETIKALLQHNASVYMASRSKGRVEHTISELKRATGKEAIFSELDLANLWLIKKVVS